MKTIGYTTESVIADMEKRPDANHPIWGEPLPGHPDIPLVRRSEAEEEIEKLKEVLKELIDHTHACEKELTEDLYRLNFCGESSSLTNAREALKDKP